MVCIDFTFLCQRYTARAGQAGKLFRMARKRRNERQATKKTFENKVFIPPCPMKIMFDTSRFSSRRENTYFLIS